MRKLRIFGYCARSARVAVAQAIGREPYTSPPHDVITFVPGWMENHDLLYFRLHGEDREGGQGRLAWYGDWGFEALNAERIRKADLGGAVAVVANCYGGDGDPMVEALYRSGCAAVVAGGGVNVGARVKVLGTDLLVQWVIRMMRVGFEIERALRWARVRLAMSGWRASDRDAARFEVVRRERC